jgi:hypothetical protein
LIKLLILVIKVVGIPQRLEEIELNKDREQCLRQKYNIDILHSLTHQEILFNQNSKVCQIKKTNKNMIIKYLISQEN